MLLLTLGVSQWIASLLVAFFLLVCLLLILIVLIQRPQGGGLSGAFGAGGGSGQTAFGAKTGDALTIATIGMFVLYLLLAIGLQFAARPAGAAPAPTSIGSTNGAGDGSTPADDLTPTEQAPPTTPEATPPAPSEDGTAPSADTPSDTGGSTPVPANDPADGQPDGG